MTSEELPGEIAVTAQPDRMAAPAGDAPVDAAMGEVAPGDPALDSGSPDGAAAGDAGQADVASDADRPRDPWFEPEPKMAHPDAAEIAGSDQVTEAAASGRNSANGLAEWFLPAGRAGLLPESITESSDGEPEAVSISPPATGLPPWAGEEPTPAASRPPPWETGPWPGPGEQSLGAGPGGGGPAGRATANGGSSRAERAADAVGNGASAAGSRGAGHSPPAAPSWQPPVAVIAGIVPLVVPGLVLGILGLRRAGPAGAGRVAYWTAIGLSVVWAIVIAVLVIAGSGSPAAGCVGYPGSVRTAYAKAISDINGKAPRAKQAADLAAAASKANSAAANTTQIPVRAALFRMASDLQQVQADVVASRPVPADVLTTLKADGTTFPRSCPG